MKINRPEKMMQIYWSERELKLICSALEPIALLTPAEIITQEDILKKCELGIEALQAFKRGDELSMEIYEICKKQNETETLV